MEVEYCLAAVNSLVNNQPETVILKALFFDHFTRNVIHVIYQILVIQAEAGNAIHMFFGKYKIVFWRLGEFIFYDKYGIGFKDLVGRKGSRYDFAKNTTIHNFLYPLIRSLSYCYFTDLGHQNLNVAGDR